MSLERKDNSIGYTESNIVLICQQFNTMDQTKNSDPARRTGSGQWNSEKWILGHRMHEVTFSKQRQLFLRQDLKKITP